MFHIKAPVDTFLCPIFVLGGQGDEISVKFIEE